MHYFCGISLILNGIVIVSSNPSFSNENIYKRELILFEVEEKLFFETEEI